MSSTFTETDILRFIYAETSEEENRQIREELKKNLQLQSYYNRMKETMREMEELEFDPDPTTVNIILEYSASHHNSLEHQ